MEVVDDDQSKAVLRFELPQLGMHVHQVGAGCVIDIQRSLNQTPELHLKLAALILVEIAGPELLLIDQG